MSDLTKTKVIDIKTGQSKKAVDDLTKSFKPLKTQIRELRDELGQLEVDSEEFAQKSKKLADLQQKQIEITEAAKYSNQDFGATMANLTNVSMGLVGGINAISASIALLGGDEEKMQKALAPITMTMAMIQGMSSIDTAIKSLQGLKNAFLGVGSAAVESAAGVETLNGGIAAANTVTGKTSSGMVKGFKAVGSGIKKAAVAMKGFISANPILLAIAAAIGAVSAGIAIFNKRLEENGRVAREEADIISNVNSAYDEQNVRLNVLLKTAQNNNESMAERKKAVEELNKIVPEYNAKINEETGAYEANNAALETYLQNLKQKLMLEAYEGKIKEYLQKQLELEEEINEIENTGWWRVKGRIRSRREEIKQLEGDINRLYDKIGGLNLNQALSDNKVATNTSKTTNAVVQAFKLIADAIKEAKTAAEGFWDAVFSARSGQIQSLGIGNEFTKMREEIYKAAYKYDLTKVFTSQFRDFLTNRDKSEFAGMFKEMFTISDVLVDPSVFEKLEKQSMDYINKIAELRDKLSGQKGTKLTAAQTKQYEAEKKQYETALENINRQLNGYNAIIDATNTYRDAMMDLKNKQEEEQAATILQNKQYDIQAKYLEDIKKGDPYADANRNIANEEAEIENLQMVNKYLKERLVIYTEDKELRRIYAEQIKQWNQQILDNEKEIKDKTIQIDIEKYNRRTQEAQNYYDEIDRKVQEQSRKLENDNILKGGGTAAYNTAYLQQKLVVDAYEKKEAKLEEMRQQSIIGEEEYNARMLELKRQLNEESAKLDDLRVDKAISALNTYIGVFNNVSSTVSGILQDQMSKYDENSKEYKNLQVANGWITTLSGSLSAFMSGFQSGLGFPWNLILAGVLGTTTFAAGAAQIANINSGSHSNALTSGASSAGTGSYETEVYRQQTELLGGITDTRVYVTEHDISSTQRRVSVREQQAAF